MTPHDRTIAVGDLEVHYLEAGSGRPLILLHGGMATCEAWGEALPRMADRYRVIAPDTRGHGRTSNPARTMSYAQFADDVAGLMAALGLEEPLILGYSDGGQTALEFGLRHPDKAAALVLGGTVGGPSPAYLAQLANWGFSAPGEVDLERLAAEFGPFFEQIKLAHAHHYGPDYWREFVAQISSLWLTLPHYSDARLAAIEVPVLVVMGEADELGGVEQARRLQRCIPRADLAIIPEAGHEAVNLPLFWEKVRAFFGRHEPQHAATTASSVR